MTTTLIGTPDPPDDPYGRDQAWQAIHTERARRAAENVAAREAAMAANVDPDTADAFAQLVADKLRTTPALGAYRDRTAPKEDTDDNPLGPYVLDWADFWGQDFDDNEWLLEPILADGRAHALYAQAKAGKSFLILAAVAALASGKPFLSHPGGDPVHVLYVDYEMTPQDVRERLEEFGYGPSDDLSRLHYALLPTLPPLDTEDGGKALLQAAQMYEARFVVIDTMSRAIQGEENTADTFKDFYRHTGAPLKQAGIGWLRLDHSGKDASKGQRGSSAKDADVDTVMRLERTDGGQRVIATHRRMSWFPEKTDIEVTQGDDGVTRFQNAQAEMWPGGTKQLADDLDRIGVPLGAGRPAARAAMEEHGITGGNELLGKALKWRRKEAVRLADREAEELVDRIVAKGHETSLKLSMDSSEDRIWTGAPGQAGQPPDTGVDSGLDSSGQSSAVSVDSGVSHVVDTPVPPGHFDDTWDDERDGEF